MQRTPQPQTATATTPTARPIAPASMHAKTSAGGAVPAAQSLAKGVVASSSTSGSVLAPLRRVLQPLDSNQRALVQTQPSSAPVAVAKAPFTYVSRFSRPLAAATATTTATTTTTATATTTLTGIKRKQPPVKEEIVAHPPTPLKVKETDETETPTDPLEQQRRENVAWLDMLVALLERKYQRHAMPVDIETIQNAKLLDAYWPNSTTTKAPAAVMTEPLPPSSSKRSRVSPAGTMISPATSSGGAAAVLSSQDDKEEKRTQALRRHAQHIHDTSVSSTSCCGCKTGCLKMYCVCFSTRGYCHDGCTCENCKNARASADLRLEAMTTYLLNDPRAFSHAAAVSSTATASNGSSTAPSRGFFQLLPQKASTVVLRGCRCKKSKCLKKYCECFQNGLGCGPHCRCVDCANDASPAAKEMREKNSTDATPMPVTTTTTTTTTTMPPLAVDGTATATTTTTTTTTMAVVAGGGPFHAIKVAVTKKPRRNYVIKSVRLRL